MQQHSLFLLSQQMKRNPSRVATRLVASFSSRQQVQKGPLIIIIPLCMCNHQPRKNFGNKKEGFDESVIFFLVFYNEKREKK